MRREPGGFGLSTLDLFKANQFRPIRTHLRKLFLLDERTRGVPGTAMAYSKVPVLWSPVELNRAKKAVLFRRVNGRNLKLSLLAILCRVPSRIFWPEVGILDRRGSLGVTVLGRK